MTEEVKSVIIIGGSILLIGGLIELPSFIDAVKEDRENKRRAELELEKTEKLKSFPPEYWEAEKAKSLAQAEVEKAHIESRERLELDSRNRIDQEKARTREFEKNAPAEYWEQKRIEAEEKTKQELNRQRYEAEIEATKQHRAALDTTSRAIESAIVQRNLFK